MKNFVLFFLASLFLVACNSNEATTEQTAPATPTDVTSTAAAGKVWHYTCPNNCENSGSDAQGLCPVCNTALAHNQAWHNVPGNQNPQTTQQPATNPTSPVIQAPTTTTTTTPTEPAQNAQGVWHYVCSNGCAGGAGAQGTCPTCGGALAHNQLYHQ